jgi:hypothetical protein
MSHSVLALAALASLAFATVDAPAATGPTRCYSNRDCGSLQFCDTEASATCGGAGVCTSRGIANMCPMLDTRACGCDGKPYANPCLAHKAGVSLDAYPFHDANIDGDTLAEQPWMDGSQSNFYTFTGNGTVDNTYGTFVQVVEPPCMRATPRCEIATVAPKTGSFYTFGSFVELDFDNGDFAFFDAQLDCHNTWQLVSDDASGPTLVVSTIIP